MLWGAPPQVATKASVAAFGNARLISRAASEQFRSDDGHGKLLGYQPNTLAGARKCGMTSSANRCIISSVSPALWP
jgi:hypothetical protein